MKIKPEHFEKLKKAIAETLATKPNAAADYKAAGLSEMRFRWDVLHAATIDGEKSLRFICDTLYKYMNDEHIDTALREIFGHPKRPKGDKGWVSEGQAEPLKA